MNKQPRAPQTPANAESKRMKMSQPWERLEAMRAAAGRFAPQPIEPRNSLYDAVHAHPSWPFVEGLADVLGRNTMNWSGLGMSREAYEASVREVSAAQQSVATAHQRFVTALALADAPANINDTAAAGLRALLRSYEMTLHASNMIGFANDALVPDNDVVQYLFSTWGRPIDADVKQADPPLKFINSVIMPEIDPRPPSDTPSQQQPANSIDEAYNRVNAKLDALLEGMRRMIAMPDASIADVKQVLVEYDAYVKRVDEASIAFGAFEAARAMYKSKIDALNASNRLRYTAEEVAALSVLPLAPMLADTFAHVRRRVNSYGPEYIGLADRIARGEIGDRTILYPIIEHDSRLPLSTKCDAPPVTNVRGNHNNINVVGSRGARLRKAFVYYTNVDNEVPKTFQRACKRIIDDQ